jgi:hypothetical protein
VPNCCADGCGHNRHIEQRQARVELEADSRQPVTARSRPRCRFPPSAARAATANVSSTRRGSGSFDIGAAVG